MANIHQVLEGITSEDEFIEELLRALQPREGAPFLPVLDTLEVKLASLLKVLQEEHERASTVEADLRLMAEVESQAAFKRKQGLLKDLTARESELSKFKKQTEQLLRQSEFVKEVETVVKRERDQNAANRVAALISQLNKEDTDLSVLPSEFSLAESIEERVLKLVVLQEALPMLGTDFQRARRGIKAISEQVSKAVLLEFREALGGTSAGRLKQMYELGRKLGLQDTFAVQYFKLLVGQFSVLYIAKQSFQQSVKDSVQTLLTGLKSGLSSHNERLRCSRLFGEYASSLMHRSLNYVLNHVLKPSFALWMDGYKDDKIWLQNLELLVSQTKWLFQELAKQDKDGLIEDYPAEWHISHSFQPFVKEYESKEQAVYQKWLAMIVNKMTETVREKSQEDWLRLGSLKTKPSAEQLSARINRFQANAESESMKSVLVQTRLALRRNRLISRVANVELNQRQIFKTLFSQFGQWLLHMVKSSENLIPNLNRKTELCPAFFPALSLYYQQYLALKSLYSEFVGEWCSGLDRADLLFTRINEEVVKVISLSLASVLIALRNTFIKLSADQLSIYSRKSTKTATSELAASLIAKMRQYTLGVGQVQPVQFRANILQSCGQQFIEYLIKQYAKLKINSAGLAQLSIDTNAYEQLIKSLQAPELVDKYQEFKALVDVAKAGGSFAAMAGGLEAREADSAARILRKTKRAV